MSSLMQRGYQTRDRRPFGYDRRSMFDEACGVIERALGGGVAAADRRRGVGIAEFQDGAAPPARQHAVQRLEGRRRRVSTSAGSSGAYDGLTRRDGFHVMHDWDGIADRVNEDTIPVDVLNYLVGAARRRRHRRCGAVDPARLLLPARAGAALVAGLGRRRRRRPARAARAAARRISRGPAAAASASPRTPKRCCCSGPRTSRSTSGATTSCWQR